VPLLNRPFLAWQLALLRAHGVADVVLSCAYRVDDLRAALGDEAAGVRLRYVVEAEPLGTGGGVRNAADLTHGTVWVLNGDVLTDADLTAMRRFHEARGAALTIMLVRVPDPRPYGVVETEPDGRIRRFREKPAPDEPLATDTINAGVYLLDAALLRRMPPGRPVSIEREFFPALIAEGVPCFGWLATAYWRDIGSPAAYHAAQMELLEGRVRLPLTPPGEPRAGAWIGPDGAADRRARVAPPAVLGAGVTLGAGACVGPRAVVGAGSTVEAEARIEDAVLWERVRVGAGAVLRGCVVGADVDVGAGARVERGVVLESGAVVAPGARLGA